MPCFGLHQFSSKIYVMLFHQVITLTIFLASVTCALEKLRGKTHVRLFSSPDRSSVYPEGPSLILFLQLWLQFRYPAMHLVSEQTCATNRGQGETLAKPCTLLLESNKDMIYRQNIITLSGPSTVRAHQAYFFVPLPRYRLPAQCNFMLISAFFSSFILLFCFLFALTTAFYTVVMQLPSCLVAFWSTAKRSSLLQCF